MERPHIVILGAGYGGLMTAIKLQKLLHVNEVKITLINRNDYHYQSAWLHENAAGTLKPKQTAIPIHNVINSHKVNFIIDEVLLIKEEEKKVILDSGEIDYDILVIGLGFEAKILNDKPESKHIQVIDSLNSARVIREHLEYNFAMYTNEKKKQLGRLNIAIIGGGFTGIEYAGQLVNRLSELSAEYDIEKTQVRIINIESGTVLKEMDKSIVNYVMNYLETRGVEFIQHAKIMDCTETTVIYEKEGKIYKIPAMTKVWAGGVRANSILEKSGINTVDSRVEVRPDLRLPGNDSIYVVGECARINSTNSDLGQITSAQHAIQQGITAARNIKAQLSGEKLTSFKMEKSPTVASLGHYDGVAVMKNGKKIFGWKAVFLKNLLENRYLLQIGGWNLLMKKGRLHLFNS